MKKATLILAALVVTVAGCTTVQVNPLSHELDYQYTPAPNVEASVDKSIAVVPFEDGRMYNGNNRKTSDSLWLNVLPLWFRTTAEVTHPEVVYNTTEVGIGDYVLASGSLADAVPQLLAEHLHRSRLFSNAKFVEYAEVKGSHNFDYVLRGTLVRSTVVARRYSWCLGPAAPVAYILGAPMVTYQADLVVDWQLYDAGGQAVGPKQRSQTIVPLRRVKGFYYGIWSNQKTTPLGLYVEAIREVNGKIAEGAAELVKAR